jgi:hypothetical protein
VVELSKGESSKAMFFSLLEAAQMDGNDFEQYFKRI